MVGHLDDDGRVRMVDVGDKRVSRRTASARGHLKLTKRQQVTLSQSQPEKGNWQMAAQIAGIQAAKRCSDLIPLCHPLPLDQVEVDVEWAPGCDCVRVCCRAATAARTGVEMEALTGVSVALLTVYDMIKGIDKGAVIGDIRLESKTGGKSGDWCSA